MTLKFLLIAVFGLIALALSIFSFYYAVYKGFIKREFVGKDPDDRETGYKAVLRGIFILPFGILFLFGSYWAFVDSIKYLK